jgi:hypothetical protein
LSSIRLIKAGCIRSLVFFSPKRAPEFPDVSPTGEATGHKWHKGVWRGVAAPKGLPKGIATQSRSRSGLWDRAEFKEFMNRRGFDMIYLDSAGFAESMKADNEDNDKALKWLGLVKQANEMRCSERSLDGANGSRECAPDDERNCARAVMTRSAKSGRELEWSRMARSLSSGAHSRDPLAPVRATCPGSSVAAPAAYRQECVRPS